MEYLSEFRKKRVILIDVLVILLVRKLYSGKKKILISLVLIDKIIEYNNQSTIGILDLAIDLRVERSRYSKIHIVANQGSLIGIG